MAGINWADLDEATRAKLMRENPELAAEFASPVAVAAPEVDPEVAAILEQVRLNNERTIDIKLETQRVAAEGRLILAQMQLARAKQGPRRRERRGSVSPWFFGWRALLYGGLFVVLLTLV